MLVKDLSTEVNSNLQIRSAMKAVNLILFSVASLQRLNSPCLTLLDYSCSLLILVCIFFASPPTPTFWLQQLQEGFCSSQILDTIFRIPFIYDWSQWNDCDKSSCKSSFSSALKGCSSLESYLCVPRSDRILIFFQSFGT